MTPVGQFTFGRTCPHCGYDLRATPRRCPECGTVCREPLPDDGVPVQQGEGRGLLTSIGIGLVFGLVLIVLPHVRNRPMGWPDHEPPTVVGMCNALQCFAADTGRMPTTDEGLQALVTCPAGLRGWRGPYTRRVPLDASGRPYEYVHDSILECYYFRYRDHDGKERRSDAFPE